MTPIETNRRDSRSTGPRTPEGKEASSMNALKHGLTARTALLPGEDPDEFRDFVWSIIEDLDPRGPVEAELAQRVGVLKWKRRRLEGAEEQALANLRERYAERTEARLQQQERSARTPEEREAVAREREEEAENGAVWDANQILADQFGGKNGGTLERLARYEHRLSQQIDSTLRLLLKLQNRRAYREQQRRREAREEREARESAPAAEAKANAHAKSKSAAVPASGEAGRTGKPITVMPPDAPAQNELPPETIREPETGPPEGASGMN